MRKPLPSGYLALVLHAHLPYVRHYSHEFHMEERWFYEAMIETYLPLVDVLSRLLHDRITFRLTLTLTPTLLALMDDPLMQTRCEAHFNKLVELAGKEVVRNKENAEFYKISLMYFHKFTHLKQIFIENQRNLIPLFRQFQESGYLDIITSASTHGFIPLMKNDETIRAQITTAVDVYRQHFGRPPMGIWLPECGYVNRVDRLLKEQGIQYFIVDTHTVQHSVPTPAADVYAPVRTTAGLHAFARDPHSSKQIWSSSLGYPGDPDYREYYRDIGFDLGWHDAAEWEYIKPYLLATGERVNTGLKYHRISADSVNKQPYEPGWASDKAGIHAGHFVESLERKVEQLSSSMPRKPMIVCPYDAELFGHWWYEGPQWIEQLCRRIHEGESNLQMVTPCEYLREYPEHEEGKLPFSSWGRGGYSGVWLQPDNDWIYKHLHLAEDRMIAAANKYRFPHDLKDADLRLANQACRELFLAQSSDWAFIIDAQTVPSYAISRIKYHLGNFHQLLDWLHTKEFSLEQLDAIERETPCFAFLHYSCFQTKGSDRLLVKSSNVPGLTQDFRPPSAGHNHILMLAWEFPPLIIGGLSRAVYDLAKFLSLQGHTIHVITCDVPHREVYEVMDQIHVHRVKVMQSLSPVDFLDWVFEMNLAFTDYAIQLVEEGYRFDLVHAHDWLVFYTARELKQLYHLPLIATIHATEHGRNHGNLQTYVQ
ncbi:MAG TPA: 1,4-alpha-glucan branching protein domain-containing protein, partial [Bacilli bacterium]